MWDVREASSEDWPALLSFFQRIYRAGHPLHRRDFWYWQFGDRNFGRSFIVASETEIRGHIGANFVDGIAWVINVFLDEQLRGQGFLRKLYDLARGYFPVASTNANKAALDMYRAMGFARYCDLQRYVKIRPEVDPADAVRPVDFARAPAQPGPQHYWTQPGILGAVADDGSSFVLQADVGGMRAVEIADEDILETTCWDMGARWIDYVTSWNDPLCRRLEQSGWINGDPIPYRLHPLIAGSRSNISVVSEQPLPKGFIIRRYHSDHGRVPSLPPQ